MTRTPFPDSGTAPERTGPHRAAIAAYDADLVQSGSHPSAVLAACETFFAVADAEAKVGGGK